ncbi:hypothetical protein D8674_037620 [Pyrus ussuriensis x Pyrus communis]|uniref:Uncharacterized protein n=1 Tax=Pyrus ussuriensis x Pyrus communis TaxID=2448454 RepID=A0A5N5GY43_9ROSA|nr:hypothetical protein D8674_037620 [Pyrus ussuriensis x Pyrus communis]
MWAREGGRTPANSSHDSPPILLHVFPTRFFEQKLLNPRFRRPPFDGYSDGAVSFNGISFLIRYIPLSLLNITAPKRGSGDDECDIYLLNRDGLLEEKKRSSKEPIDEERSAYL